MQTHGGTAYLCSDISGNEHVLQVLLKGGDGFILLRLLGKMQLMELVICSGERSRYACKRMVVQRTFAAISVAMSTSFKSSSKAVMASFCSDYSAGCS